MAAVGCLQKFVRKKYIDLSTVTNTQLARCLSPVDLVALGISSTLGAGIYVVAGDVARNIAGPSVLISFLIAGITSVLAGLCYAEFGARVPKAGSAYVYSYVTLGELWAFIIGWNLILEYVIGTASVARAWSSYFDSLFNNRISAYFITYIPMNIPSLAPYPDFFALGITLLLCAILTLGVKESSILNNVFTIINLLVVSYVVICGFFKINSDNWRIHPSQVPNATLDGNGGFFPFGWSGTFSGAATCFYAFVGFDVIATTGEEAKNPQRNIPIGIILSLAACFMAYCGVSSILTLMVPYYAIDVNAPLPDAFKQVGWGVAQYVIAVGAVCGLSTSLLGGMFPMPRIVYAMASDGLLFKFLAYVSPRLKTPVVATIVTGIIAGVMAMMLDLKELVDMMSIGTLLAYTLVAACVLILRYEVSQSGEDCDMFEEAASETVQCFALLRPTSTRPTQRTSMTVKLAVFLLGVLMVCSSGIQVALNDKLRAKAWWAVLLLVIFLVTIVILMFVISRQPCNPSKLTFKVPLVPWVPAISMFINLYLMLQLSAITWLRFAVWMVLGFIIYFSYGMWHSSQQQHNQQFSGVSNYEPMDCNN